MALTDENNGIGTTMLVSPTGNMGGVPYPVMMGGNNSGFGDQGAWWIVLLIIILVAAGGWNNGNQNGGMFGGAPIVVNDSNGGAVQRGFDQAAIMSGINALTSNVCNGFADVQQSLCSGFAGVNQSISNGFAQAEIAENARQMANMQQLFGVQSALQNCCCENRAGLADLKYTIATEACADRAAVNDALRDVLAANTASTQRILDQLCSDKIDAKNEKIAELQRELQMAQLAASQRTQTQTLLTDNLAQTNALEQYLAPVPRPAYIVQNPNCCSNSCGCGNF